MATFFEKLKMGMGIEAENEQESLAEKEKIIKEKPKKPRIKKEKVLKSPPLEEKKPAHVQKEIAVAKEEIIVKEEKKAPEKKVMMGERPEASQDKKISIMMKQEEQKEKMMISDDQPTGQLAVDVYQTEEYLVIQSAIAGVKADALDITMEGDMVSIRGTREKPLEENEKSYFYQECYWGPFSRQILLSVEVDPSRAEASLKEGILSIKIPKIEKDKKRKLVVRE